MSFQFGGPNTSEWFTICVTTMLSVPGRLTVDCPRSLCLVKSRGFAHLAALGLVSMMLHVVTIKTVLLVGLAGMHKTSCSGETRLGFCTQLAHHEPESVLTVTIVTRLTHSKHFPRWTFQSSQQYWGCMKSSLFVIWLFWSNIHAGGTQMATR